MHPQSSTHKFTGEGLSDDLKFRRAQHCAKLSEALDSLDYDIENMNEFQLLIMCTTRIKQQRNPVGLSVSVGCES